MSKFTRTLLSATVALTATVAAEAAGGTFILSVDDASHLKLKTGYGANLREIPLVTGDNEITYENWSDYVLVPVEGYLIDTITAYDSAGTALGSSGWSYSSTDDSYTNYWTAGSPADARYVVTTKEYRPEMWTVTVDIDNPDALDGSVFYAGNQKVTATAGINTVSFNPEKGKDFAATLTLSVLDATLTRNGDVVAPQENSAPLKYAFELTDGDAIALKTELENPVFTLTIADPSHVSVTFPDDKTPLTGLEAGVNSLSYAVGDQLEIKAAEGYRLLPIEGMSYFQYDETYFYSFKGGESGINFDVQTEVYEIPYADVTINVVEPELIDSYYVSTYERGFTAGDNLFRVNTDKIKNTSLYYNVENTGDVIATLDGSPLEVSEYWYEIYSDISALEPRPYRVVVRRAMTGEWKGETDYVPSSDYKVWTVNFEPGGIAEYVGGIPTMTKDGFSADGSVEIVDGNAVITFPMIEKLESDDYTLTLPAEMLRVNGAVTPVLSHDFTVMKTGVDGVESDTYVTVYAIDGRRVLDHAPLEEIRTLPAGVYIVNGHKVVIR